MLPLPFVDDASAVAAGAEQAAEVVIATTPLAGVEIPLDWLPSNARAFAGEQLASAHPRSVADFLARRAPSVHLNETQGNPLQPDLSFRGFTVSPLLGTPQGLAVYVDGVRVNDPFGDTVHWELLPESALASVELLPGAVPTFGLNALGGALVLRTRDGLSWQGTTAEVGGGSFGGRRVRVDHGGRVAELGWYAAVDRFEDAGWRDDSASAVTRGFGKLSHAGDRGVWSLAWTQVSSQLSGNGLLPLSLLASRRSQVFTHPDRTWNRLSQAVLTGTVELHERANLAVSTYHRASRGRSLNGDLNDEFEDGPWDGLAALDSGANNRTGTAQQATGVAVQWNGEHAAGHRWSIGTAYDAARIRFLQTAEIGELDISRGVVGGGDVVDENALRATTRSLALHAAGTLVLLPELQFTAAAHYHASRIRMRDLLVSVPPNLDGDHRYASWNPSLGMTWQPTAGVTVYASAGQSGRMPTPLELGCADPEHPCTLPNALAADPHLEQVRARTVEAGVRGEMDRWRWHAGVFRSVNRRDILFVGTSTSAGYFTNFGRTRRQGLELSLARQWRAVAWQVQVSGLQATFRDGACLLSADNSTRGVDAACTAAGQDDEIRVNTGDRLPGTPAWLGNSTLEWKPSPRWSVAIDIQGASQQFARGNENNRHRAGVALDAFGNERSFQGEGRVPGYFTVGVQWMARISPDWSVSLRVANAFNRRYATASALAENPFDDAGRFLPDSDAWRHETFVAPAAPRTFWLSLRYAGGSSERSPYTRSSASRGERRSGSAVDSSSTSGV